MNANDSDFGESDSDDENDVKNSCSFVNADDAASEPESDPENNEPPVKLVTSKAPVRKAAKNEYVWKIVISLLQM